MDISLLRNERGLFSLFELADLDVVAEALGLDRAVASNNEVIGDVMSSLLITAGQQASGVILEPDWGLGAYAAWLAQTSLPKPPGLVLRVDTPPAVPSTSTLPSVSNDWGIENITNNYGLVYIKLWYHPSEEEALAKKQLIGELYDFCLQQETELVLELLMQSPDGKEVAADVQLTAVQELRATTHLLALEVPADPLATATLTAELDLPWIATAKPKQNFEDYKADVIKAMENGAQGYLAGHTAWNDVSQLKRADQGADINQIKTFINTTFRERLESLNQILAENGQVS